MSNQLDNVDVANVLPSDNTPGRVASSLVDDVINNLDPTNINNASLGGVQSTPTPTYTATADDVTVPPVVDRQTLLNNAIAATNDLQVVDTQPVSKTNDITGEDVMNNILNTAGSNMTAEMAETFKTLVAGMEEMFKTTYAKKLNEVEEQKQREIDNMKIEMERDKVSKMSENERKVYEAELNRQAEQIKIQVMEQRIKELEQDKIASENRDYLAQQINAHPYARDYIAKMGIKTKEEYKAKIEPILQDLKELVHLRTSNTKYGNANALGNYNRKSDERKDITDQIKSRTSTFLDSVIMK